MSRPELLEAHRGRPTRRAMRSDCAAHSAQTRYRDIKDHRDTTALIDDLRAPNRARVFPFFVPDFHAIAHLQPFILLLLGPHHEATTLGDQLDRHAPLLLTRIRPGILAGAP